MPKLQPKARTKKPWKTTNKPNRPHDHMLPPSTTCCQLGDAWKLLFTGGVGFCSLEATMHSTGGAATMHSTVDVLSTRADGNDTEFALTRSREPADYSGVCWAHPWGPRGPKCCLRPVARLPIGS